MRPNLKSYNINELHLSCTLTLSEDLIGKIRETSPPDHEGGSIFLDSYKEEVSHRSWAWVVEADKSAKRFRIELNYELGSGGKISKSIPDICKLLGILSVIEEEIEVSCQVSFLFAKRLKARPVVPLPMKLIELDDMPFDEISGVHLEKRSDGEKYDVFLGILEKQQLLEIILFDHHTRLQETLVDEIIAEAVKISDRFILKGE